MSSNSSEKTYKVFYSPTSILLVIVTLAQAVIFKWELGTMVWIYWAEGVIIALLGMYFALKRRSSGYFMSFTFLLCIIGSFGFFLLMSTVPFENGVYTVNGVRVSPEEFVKLKDTSWVMVAANAVLILIFNIILFSKEENGFHSASSLGALARKIIPIYIIIFAIFFTQWAVVVFIILKGLLSFETTTDKDKKGLLSYRFVSTTKSSVNIV